MELEIVKPEQFGLEQSKASELLGNLPQIQMERQILEDSYNSAIEMDIEDPKSSKIARDLRLKIRDNRTKGISIWAKTSKDVFLKAGQFIDAVRRREESINQRMEDNLEKIEKHAETKEYARKLAINNSRVEELQPYFEFVPFGLNFGDMSDDEYMKILNGSKLQFERRVEEERKIEEERKRIQEVNNLHELRKERLLHVWDFVPIAFKSLNMGMATDMEFRSVLEDSEKMKKDVEVRQEQIRQENEKLAKEKKELEDKAKRDKEISDKKIAEEKEKQERLRKEIQDKRDLELKQENERLQEIENQKKEAEKLAKAPIKKQLNTWVDNFKIGEFHSDNEVAKEISERFESFKLWAKKTVDNS